MASTSYSDWYMGAEVNLAALGVQHLKTALPEASVAPASTEAALLESLAVQLGPVQLGFQMVPARVIDHLMVLYGLSRFPGYKAEGKVRFWVNPTAGQVTVPAGTVLRHYLQATNELREYRTVENLLVLPMESTSGEVQIEATTVGTEHNGVPVGSSMDFVDVYNINVERIEMSVSPRGGEGPESDESWYSRSAAQLQRQVSTLVVPEQFESAALTRGEVGRAYVLDLYDPDTPSTESPGHVTLAVTDSEGLPLTPRERPELQSWLKSQAMASLQVHVIDATYTSVHPTIVVESEVGATLSTVEQAVKDAVKKWLNPATWSWWGEITPYDFVSAIDDVPGVARVVTVPNKITLSGKAPLPKLGNMIVRVEESTRAGGA